jgi:hypothetical protein
MFTYFALLNSYELTVFYTIYCILWSLTSLVHICIYSYSIPFLRFVCIRYSFWNVRYCLLDITALPELEAQAFRYTSNH